MPSTNPLAQFVGRNLPGGAHWSGVIRRGVTLRFAALGAGANVSVLLYNHEDRSSATTCPIR